MAGTATLTIMIAEADDVAVLRPVAMRHGGTATGTSDARATFAFPTPTAALNGALEMQRVLPARIGIAVGEVTRGPGGYRGDCVTRASGLCTKAHAGQTLLTDLVREMTRSHGRELRAMGDLAIEGLRAPVRAWELPPDPVADTRWPMPARLDRVASPSGFGFIGRERELALLDDAVKQADSGRQRVVMLSGEPGIGKTSLIREMVRGAQEQEAIVLYGGCDEDAGLPYQPFAEALGDLVAHVPRELLEEHVATHGPQLVRLAPVLATRVRIPTPAGAVDPETELYMLFASVTALVDRVCRDATMVLVLDDLHWADKPTWILLRHLLRSRSDRRLLAICAFRSTEIGASPTAREVLADLHQLADVSRIRLTGLDTAQVAAIVGGALDEPAGDTAAFAAALREETEGNPFFTIEVLRDLAESGNLRNAVLDAGHAIEADGAPPVPLSVREVISHRVDRLGEETRSVLTTAAVIGHEFDFAVLQRLTGLDDEALLTLLERTIGAGVLEEITTRADRFCFAHTLIRRCLEDELTETRRARAHRQVAETLESLWGQDLGPRIRELAHHFAAAGPTGDLAKAVDYSRRAGDAALGSLAPDEAARWYETALRMYAERSVPDGGLRTDLLIDLGGAQRQAGLPSFRETLLEAAARARSAHDTDRLVRAVLANNRGRFGRVGAVDGDRVEMLEAALGATSGDSPERARLLATLAVELTFSPRADRRHYIAEEARAMARRLGDPGITVAVYNRTYDTVAPTPALDRRYAEAAEAASLARDLADPVDRFFACYYGIRASIEYGELAPADSYLAECIEIADGLGQPYLLWWAAFLSSWRALLAGRVSEAEAHANRSLEIGTRSGQPEATLMFAALVAEIRRHEGRVDDIPALINPAFADFAADVPLVRALLAQSFCEVGDHERARALLLTDSDNGFAGLPLDYQWIETITGYAEVCARLGDRDLAVPLYEQLAPWHRCIPCTGGAQTRGAVALYLGMLAVLLGEFDAADGYFREAVELHQRLQAPFWTARSQLEWAKLLESRSLFLEARDLAEQYGCEAIAREAGAALS